MRAIHPLEKKPGKGPFCCISKSSLGRQCIKTEGFARREPGQKDNKKDTLKRCLFKWSGMAYGLPKDIRGGKSNPCLSGKIQGKTVKVAFVCGQKLSAPLILYGGFAFLYRFPARWNRERTGIKRVYYFNPFFMNSWVLDFL